MRGPDKARFEDFYGEKQEQRLVYPAWWDTHTHPGARPGDGVCKRAPGGRTLVHCVQLGSAQEGNVGPSSCGPAGGAIEFWCNVDRVAVKGRGLGGPIPSC